MSFALRIRAPVTAGMLARKLNLNAVFLSKPSSRPVLIVVPLLLIPGRTASPWAVPMRAALNIERDVVLSSDFGMRFSNTDRSNIMAVIISIEAANRGDKKRFSPYFSIIRPTMPVGTVAMHTAISIAFELRSEFPVTHANIETISFRKYINMQSSVAACKSTSKATPECEKPVRF